MIITNLLVQYLENPLGIETKNPLLSYTLESGEQNRNQGAYRIVVASSIDYLSNDIGDLWDSGKVLNERNYAIRYNGSSLLSRQEVFWKVKVWDNHHTESEWSEPASWEMGLLEDHEWTASWIGQGDHTMGNKSSAPQAATDFEVPDCKRIVKARAYISGLGLFQASINGSRLDDHFFNPGESDFSKTVYYVTYDITNRLKNGTNAIGIVIGNGQYVNFKVNPVMLLDDHTEAPEHRYQKNDSGYLRQGIYGEKKAIAQIEMTYEDGSIEVVAATDGSWKITDSPITFNNWYGGEDYDATAEISGWDMPGSDRTRWQNAALMSPPLGKLKAREFHPARITEKFPAASVTRLNNGHLLVDMGRNVAGFPEIVLHGMKETDRGTVIQMFPAEILNDAGTAVDQSSCTQSWSERYHCSIKNSYTVRGTGDESWHPSFCYQGFRYVEVAGFGREASITNFNCCVLRVSNEKTGTFETSNPVINQINEMTERSIESNMFFSFTDCPQIEKIGWLETTHLMFRSMAAGYDIRSWIPKIVQDMIDSQTDETDIRNGDTEQIGYIPAIAPEYHRIVGLHRDPNWSGACILTPWEYYQIYGDESILVKAYPAMKRYIAYLESQTVNGLLNNYAQMGDWGQLNESTPKVLVENCAYYYLLSTMAQISNLLRDSENAERFLSQASDVRGRFHNHRECYQPERKVYGNDSQSSYGCVLFSGIVLEENKESSIGKLVEAVRQRDYHLSSGEVGLKQVFSVLGKYGHNDVVYRMVMNDTQPNYKFFVDNGLTTLPEYWNYEELWHGMARSRNHAMMGHVKEWLTSYVLGIRMEAPGYRNMKIEPALTHTIGKAQGSIASPYGAVRVAYDRNEDGMHLEVQIPVGTTADVGIPAIGSGKINTGGSSNNRIEKQGQTYWIQNVGSGHYKFTII
ncbi:family 78 glycoside hydrolase catalytic domain [Paenibacillus harenae]|uniref:family 78 glycoside hydrolase catalytic domain n=1 Tax=Paenibacillus harenae TaxID=306543 RepID=UPI002793F019|nr:family 78 glycoside hydrolase catalytic domain [Paenibacillus harenae]MDQ0062258.1 alpha-L-rhamnosidase [Paenibacillus harenae]